MSEICKPFHIVLYSRPGCHLCDEVELHIKTLALEFPLTMTVVDIRSDLALEEKYMFTIPVVEIDGEEVFLSVDSVVTEEELRVEFNRRKGNVSRSQASKG